jgi:hypothetical protein
VCQSLSNALRKILKENRQLLVSVSMGCHRKYYGWVNQTVISPSFGGSKSKIKMTAGLVPGEASMLVSSVFFQCLHMASLCVQRASDLWYLLLFL